nr:peptidylprolyl isomerase [Oscillospiraceae bacterium]
GYADCSFLDGNYAAFGEVTQGMEVVDSFLDVSRSYNSNGELAVPDSPITMKEVTMIDPDENGNPRVQIIMDTIPVAE